MTRGKTRGWTYLVCTVLGLALNARAQESKAENPTYTGEITKIDKKSKTITIKGPAGGLVPDTAAPPRGRGTGAAPAGGRRGSRGTAGAATPRGPNMRPFEDVETKFVVTDETSIESSNGTLKIDDLKVGDYILVEVAKEGKKIRAIKIKRTTAAEG